MSGGGLRCMYVCMLECYPLVPRGNVDELFAGYD